MGEFRAFETATGMVVPELTAANCGQLLLGVEQSVFRRSGFIRFSDLPVTGDDALRRYVKAADKLSAYIKCVEEQKAGNTEFDSAAKATMEAMKAMEMPELNWFIENCLEPFSLNIDQL